MLTHSALYSGPYMGMRYKLLHGSAPRFIQRDTRNILHMLKELRILLRIGSLFGTLLCIIQLLPKREQQAIDPIPHHHRGWCSHGSLLMLEMSIDGGDEEIVYASVVPFADSNHLLDKATEPRRFVHNEMCLSARSLYEKEIAVLDGIGAIEQNI